MHFYAIPLLLLVSCSFLPERNPASLPERELLWSEEFSDDFNGKPDPNLWDYDADSIRNHESQCYTINRRENVRVEEGYLHLVAKKEEYKCQIPTVKDQTFHYTSGSIRTRKWNKGPVIKDMSFGSYEIRAKMPVGRGVWPAIWLLGTAPGLGWPHAGEIDIMELVGYEQADGLYRIHSTLHKDPKGAPWPVNDPGINMSHVIDLDGPLDRDFHVYRLDWTPEKLEFFIDGKRISGRIIDHDPLTIEKHDSFTKSEVKVKTPEDWPYGHNIPGQQFYMILNLAIGGDWGGIKGIDDSMFEQGPVEVIIDYVRVYKN